MLVCCAETYCFGCPVLLHSAPTRGGDGSKDWMLLVIVVVVVVIMLVISCKFLILMYLIGVLFPLKCCRKGGCTVIREKERG